MARLPAIVLLTCSSVSLVACTPQSSADTAGGGGERIEWASMVLHYPHDEHELGELPTNLDTVAGASAQVVRRDDRIRATMHTTITAGHVGKLLAVVINNPSACEVPTPGSACGPHEEEFNRAADGGFYLGEGGVAGPDGAISLTMTAAVGDTSNLLCGGAANPDFDPCGHGFALRDPWGAEVTLVLLGNGPASDDRAVRARQLASASPCPTCPPFTEQIAIGFAPSSAAQRRQIGSTRPPATSR